MKNLKYYLGVFTLVALVFTSCQDDDGMVGDIVAPSNIQIQVDKVGADANNPNGDGSGRVNFTATADNAIAIHFVVQDQTKLAKNGNISHDFTVLGENTYAVTVIAYGTGGVSANKTIEVDVLSLYEPPADLLEMLTSNNIRTFRIHSEVPNHFGLGPVGTTKLGEWWPNGGTPDKSHTGMYDDRYVFNIDGTFTHVTGGTVFGRENLINEIGGPGDGTVEGADILNYSYADYSGTWAVTAPGGVETLTLSGLGFIGYYIGGNHSYKIFDRTSNGMSLISTDGNNEFDWNFILIAE